MTPPGDPPSRAPKFGGGMPTWGGDTRSDEGDPPHVDEAVLVKGGTLDPSRTPTGTDPSPGVRSTYHLWKAIDNQASRIGDLGRELAEDRKENNRRHRIGDVVAWVALLVWLATASALVGGAALLLAHWWRT